MWREMSANTHRHTSHNTFHNTISNYGAITHTHEIQTPSETHINRSAHFLINKLINLIYDKN